MTNEVRELALEAARRGDRVAFLPDGEEKHRVLWKGLGNRSGLYDYADEKIRRDWEKSGARLKRRLESLSSGVLTLQRFRNVTRDRGRWRAYCARRI
jgi:hypothetical protein